MIQRLSADFKEEVSRPGNWDTVKRGFEQRKLSKDYPRSKGCNNLNLFVYWCIFKNKVLENKIDYDNINEINITKQY